MQLYEYTVIPAPSRGEKVRGARTGAERFSYALLTEMNRMAALGWEYVRAETLPCEERSGLTSRTTVYHNVLVFRRALAPAEPHHRTLTASHEAPVPPPVRPAPAAPAALVPPEVPAESPSSTPSPDWPDAGAAEGAVTDNAAAAVDAYDEPGFDPAPRGDGAVHSSPTESAQPPAFTRRPPLAAARDDSRRDESARGVFSGGITGNRLGPADR